MPADLPEAGRVCGVEAASYKFRRICLGDMAVDHVLQYTVIPAQDRSHSPADIIGSGVLAVMPSVLASLAAEFPVHPSVQYRVPAFHTYGGFLSYRIFICYHRVFVFRANIGLIA